MRPSDGYANGSTLLEALGPKSLSGDAAQTVDSSAEKKLEVRLGAEQYL